MFNFENVPADWWEKSVPKDLLELVRDKRELYGEAFDGFALVTLNANGAHSHNDPQDWQCKAANSDLSEVLRGLNPELIECFNELMRQRTPPATFKAYFEILCDAMAAEATALFRRLLEIGKAQQQRIGIDYSVWAEKQTWHAIRSQGQAFVLWVMDLCNQGEAYIEDNYSPQLIFGRWWLAPRFLVMDPSPGGTNPFDASRAWERLDYNNTRFVLSNLAERFFQGLDKKVELAAIDYRHKRAMSVRDQQAELAEPETLDTMADRASSAPAEDEKRRNFLEKRRDLLVKQVETNMARRWFSVVEASILFRLTDRQARNWVEEGLLTTAGRGKVTADSLRERYQYIYKTQGA
jgi:hypothetical protein